MTDAAVSTLADALAQAQAEFPVIERSRTVTVKTKTGGQYTFTYAPLDAILGLVRPALARHGLAVSQLLTEIEGRPALRTELLHKSGDTLGAVFPLPSTESMSPQELGSLLTYLRRYAIVALLGIATEDDDDGNRASAAKATGSSRAAQPVTSPPPAAPPVEDKSADNGQVISEAQLKRLWTIWRNTGIPDQVLRDLIQKIAGVDSTKQIPKAKYDELIAAIEEAENVPF